MGSFDNVINEDRTLLASEARTATASSDLQDNPSARGVMVALNVSAVTAATNEVQSLAVDATGGTFTMTFGADTTSALAYDISSANLQTALQGLTSIGSGNATVSGGVGGAGGANPYVITFVSALAATNVAQLTTDATSLTGGAQTAIVSTTTPGTPASSIVLTVLGRDTVSGSNTTLRTGTTVTATGLNIYRVYPGLTAAAGATVSDHLPKKWLVSVTHGNVSPTTYSVGATLLA